MGWGDKPAVFFRELSQFKVDDTKEEIFMDFILCFHQHMSRNAHLTFKSYDLPSVFNKTIVHHCLEVHINVKNN